MRSTTRRAFLRDGITALGAVTLAPRFVFGQEARDTIQRNWAKNVTYSSTVIHKPSTTEEVCRLMREGKLPHALGSRHSFSTIADTTGEHISTANLAEILKLDREAKTVTVGAGIRYGELGSYLEERGLAVHNLASLPHISVGGAVATGTHGSGDTNGNLSTAVVALKLVKPNGEVVELSKKDEKFYAAVVSLGALGVVTELTLEVVPSFQVAQVVYEGLPLEQLEKHFDDIMAAAYSSSLFTDYQQDSINSVWRKIRVEKEGRLEYPKEWYGATAATVDRHPVTRLSAEPCTPQLGLPGAWIDRLPHFKMDFQPSVGKELQTEMFVPRKHAVAAYKAINGLREALKPVLIISEVRSMSADELWMSPAYGRETVSFHFTWTDDGPGVQKVLPQLAKALKPFEVRAHWGKLFPQDARYLRGVYPKFDDFRKVCAEFDPDGRLQNDFLKEKIFAA